MVELSLYSYGPRTSVSFDCRIIDVDPDIFIAVEGVGTFEGVSVERKIQSLLSAGKDPAKTAAKVHRESTQRGHASITTSLSLQLEVRECSRALSMLLVAPPFGSYLQESQRRAIVTHSSIITPRFISEHHRRLFEETAHRLVDGYKQLTENGVTLEDARYILPICTKTSLYISCTLETYVAFLQLGDERLRQYLPQEVHEFAEKFHSLAKNVAPIMVEARLTVKHRLVTYPYPNPFKPSDPFFTKLLEGREPDEPSLLSLQNLLTDKLPQDVFASRLKEVADTVNPLINAVTLEPLSLVAYHQAIRHRTVPTAVESIYTAAERALKNHEKNIIIPPDVKTNPRNMKLFAELCGEALECYDRLVRDGCRLGDAVLILPQALRLYAVRAYNGFNLLYPSGFVATRTCSYAQWEERGIAYKILHEVVKKAPELETVMGEKCRQLGYCPEKTWCPIILKYHKYSDELHQRMQRS
jgi:thymidylate synthase (FAD)